jgi:hypothetical protein
MDGLILLAEAREAGLAVAAESGKLIIRGPKRAEPVALRLIGHKVDVIRALADATGWPARHREAFAYWRALHPEHEATHLAWGELQGRWHKLHGERVLPDLCAGCRRPLGNVELLHLGDGNRVHLDNLNCVIRHGERWRRAATRALVAIGLQPAAEEGTP